MQIELTHFRCWEKKTFTLPSQGMCLIHGRSGRGKSTLLNAIYYAITGKLKNITTFQKRSTTVRVEWPDLVVTRSRLPTKLVVVYRQQTYEEDAAQAVLDQLFGAQFGATSYIDQDNSFSFVNLSPADKMEFLERAILELQGNSIEKMRSHIRDQISQVKLHHAELEGKSATLTQLLGGMQKVNVPLVKIESNTVQSHTVEKLTEKVTSNLSILERNAKVSQNRIRRLEEQQSTFLREQERRRAMQREWDELNRELAELSEFANPEEWQRLQHRRDRLMRTQEVIRKKEQWTLAARRLEQVREEHTQQLARLQSEREKIPSIDAKILTCLRDAARRWDELVELDASLDGFDREMEKEALSSLAEEIARDRECERQWKSQQLVCPQCQTGLSYFADCAELKVSTSLSTNATNGEEERKKCHLRLLQNDKKRVEAEKRFHHLSALCDRYNDRLSALEALLLPFGIEVEEEAIETRLSEMEKHQQTAEKLDRELAHLKESNALHQAEREEQDARRAWETSRGDQLDEDEDGDLHDLIRICSVYGEKHQRVCRLQAKKHTLESSSSSIGDGGKKEDIQSEKEEEDALKQEREKLGVTQEKIDKYRLHLHQLNEWKTAWEKRKAYEDLEVQCETIRDQKQECMDQMRAWVKLRDHIKAAEQICMREFVQSLNTHASVYLEQFFDDDEVRVELKCIEPDSNSSTSSTSSTSKTARSLLQFEVQYRGSVCDLSSLSGGEKDRVNLAFTLALSELLHPSLLMLDECISSLDAETTALVLETLKKTYKGKLVLLVSHQANLGWFDEVVEV